MDKLVCIFIGGGFGSVLRYLVTQIACRCFAASFVGTFIANMTGCFVMGLVMGIIAHKTTIIPQNLKLFLTVGFLGGLTTFSTFSFETWSFIKDGKFLLGTVYMVSSCLLSLLFVFWGFYISAK